MCLEFRFAHHTSHLTPDERKAVRYGLETGAIRVVSATPLLLQGVNLGFDNTVMLDPVIIREGEPKDVHAIYLFQGGARAGRPKKGLVDPVES